MKLIYLDYNATTPLAPAVQEAMLPYISEFYGNPSSTHMLGRSCQEAIEDARSRVAAVIGAQREEIVFTSGGTESNNLAIFGVLHPRSITGGEHFITSAIEHPAVLEPAKQLERMGVEVTYVPCDRLGVIDPADVEKALRPETRLVSLMLANNEIGTLQPIAEVGELCRHRDVLLHTDAAQAVGKTRTLVSELNVDLLTIAGHKLYAPKGVGALYVRQGVPLEPILFGAGHERGLRPGTENVASIVGLGKACEVSVHALEDASDRMARQRDLLLDYLQRGIDEGLVVHGFQAERLPNTLSVSFPGVRGYELLQRASEICASTGSACHSHAGGGSTTLAAMGATPEIAAGTVRFSVGWFTDDEEIERASGLVVDAWEQLVR